MFARLAPHCGMQPVYGARIGSSEMHGGFSWASLGSSLSSGLSRLGSFVGSTAARIGNSEAFKQAKQGFLQSGVLENAGQLAGHAVSSLVDVGRVKLESELQRLRDRAGVPLAPTAVAQAPAVSQEQLAQLLAANPPPGPAMSHAPQMTSAAAAAAAPELGPVLPPADGGPPPAKRRKRKRVSGWGAALDNLLGHGVATSSKRMCH